MKRGVFAEKQPCLTKKQKKQRRADQHRVEAEALNRNNSKAAAVLASLGLSTHDALQEPIGPPNLQYNAQTEYTLQKCKVDLGRQLADYALHKGIAHLEAEPGFGKTLVVGTALNFIRYHRHNSTPTQKEKILCVNVLLSGGTDSRKAYELGSSLTSRTTMFLPSNAAARSQVELALRKDNFASVIMSKRGFTRAAGGFRMDFPGDKISMSFSELPMETVRTGNFDADKFFDGVPNDADMIPWLLRTCVEQKIGLLVIFLDELQVATSQIVPTIMKILERIRAFASGSWAKHKFKVIVITACANVKARIGTIGRSDHLINRAGMHAEYFEDFKNGNFVINEEVVQRVEAECTVKASEQDDRESGEYRQWQTGNSRAGGLEPQRRQVTLRNPDDPSTIDRIGMMLIMTPLLHDPPPDTLPLDHPDVLDRFGEPHTVGYRRDMSTCDRNSNNIYLTYTLARNATEVAFTAMDAVQFLEGKWKNDAIEVPYNCANPRKVAMRRIKEKTSKRSDLVFEAVDHFHCVLVVVPAHVNNLICDLHDYCEQNSKQSKRTRIFNYMALDEKALFNMVNSEVRPAWERNDVMPVILVTTKYIAGVTFFGDLVTCVVTFGLDKNARTQMFGRVARDPNPQSGKVYPKPGEYVFLDLCCNVSSAVYNQVVNHKSFQSSEFDTMVALCTRKGADMSAFLTAIAKIDKPRVQNLCKKVFFNYNASVRAPLQFCDGAVSYNEPTTLGLVEKFVKLYQARENKSDVWTKTFKSYLERWVDFEVMRRRSVVVRSTEEGEEDDN